MYTGIACCRFWGQILFNQGMKLVWTFDMNSENWMLKHLTCWDCNNQDEKICSKTSASNNIIQHIRYSVRNYCRVVHFLGKITITNPFFSNKLKPEVNVYIFKIVFVVMGFAQRHASKVWIRRTKIHYTKAFW